jgi:ATP-dependent Clp protease ATP-binding subunit ClpA
MVLTGLEAQAQAGSMFERFTAYARHTVVLSQEEARRMNHNYIGTEHILLGLLGEPDGVAYRVLEAHGITLKGAREEVTELIGPGKHAQRGGHIPFTPRAKKVLELALREALQLHHNYIGTEHILLGLLREGDGVAAQIMRKHADLMEIRMAVLDAVPAGKAAEEGETGDEATNSVLRWLRQRLTVSSSPRETRLRLGHGEAEPALRVTPAGEITLTEATRLAGEQPVGSHHLLLAALADADSAAARALANLGVDLDQAKEALRAAEVAGTTDEQPEQAGRRQMIVHVSEDKVTIEAADPLILVTAQAALRALGDDAVAAGEIRGDQPAGAPLAPVWQALRESLARIRQNAEPPEAA